MLGRGFAFKLFGDGKADGIEFLTPQAYQLNQTFAELIDDRVGMIRSLAPPIRDYHIGTAGRLKISTRLFISYRW